MERLNRIYKRYFQALRRCRAGDESTEYVTHLIGANSRNEIATGAVRIEMLGGTCLR